MIATVNALELERHAVGEDAASPPTTPVQAGRGAAGDRFVVVGSDRGRGVNFDGTLPPGRHARLRRVTGVATPPERRPGVGYRPIEEASALGRVLCRLARPSPGEFALAFGPRPRSSLRVGMLRRAVETVGGALTGVLVVGLVISFGQGRGRSAASFDTEAYWSFASLGVRATLTLAGFLVPLLVALSWRAARAESDHRRRRSTGRKRDQDRPFDPDPRSQPTLRDLWLPVLVGVAWAVPVWLLFW
jgi:hypothetical protein